MPTKNTRSPRSDKARSTKCDQGHKTSPPKAPLPIRNKPQASPLAKPSGDKDRSQKSSSKRRDEQVLPGRNEPPKAGKSQEAGFQGTDEEVIEPMSAFLKIHRPDLIDNVNEYQNKRKHLITQSRGIGQESGVTVTDGALAKSKDRREPGMGSQRNRGDDSNKQEEPKDMGNVALKRFMADPDDETKQVDLIKAMDKMFRAIRVTLTRLTKKDKRMNNLVTVTTEMTKIYAEVQDLTNFDWALLTFMNRKGPMEEGLRLLGLINTEVWVNAYRIMPQLPYELMADFPPLEEVFPDLESMGEAVVAAHCNSHSDPLSHVKCLKHSHTARSSTFQWPKAFDDLLPQARLTIRHFGDLKHVNVSEYSRLREEKPNAFLLLEQCTMSNIITASLSET